MRVHAFARRFPSLTQTFVLNQCTGLCALGVDLTVFADGPDDTGLVHPDVAASGIARRTRYYAIPEPWPARAISALRLLASRSPLGVRQRMALLAPRRGGREAMSLRLLFEAAAVARETPPVILHAHFGPVGAMVESLRGAGVIDAPLVTTFYGYDVSRTPASHYKYLFRHGDAFLVLSESMRTRLVAMGAPADRVHVHRLGVDLERFVPAARGTSGTHGRRGAPHLLSIARLVPKKGIANALRAVARARVAAPDLRYTIIGDGPLRAELQELAQTLGLAAAVRFTGWLEQAELIAVARTANALLAPSVTAPDGDTEGTPMAILEAQALGLPVLATRHAGIHEAVAEGESALLVEEHDIADLAAAIDTITATDAARRMGEAGRALVERQNDIRRLNEALLSRYGALAGMR